MFYRLSNIDVPTSFGGVPRWISELATALIVVASAVFVRILIDLVAPGAVPFALMFPAVLFATLLAGWRCGMVTMVLGGSLSWYIVHRPAPPETSPLFSADIVSVLLFLFAASLVILVTDAFRRSARMINAERAALHESEERFRLVAENAPVNLWMGDAEGKCVYLNKAQREFWGVPEDLSGFSWGSSLLEEDAAGLYEVFGKAMAAREAFEVEARYRRADGEVRTLATRAQPRIDGDGTFLGMIGVNVDVTESRLAEKHQRLLLNELNHRVKNTLATVQSLALQSLKGRDGQTAMDIFNRRLLALSAAHDVLTRENWEAASLQEIASQATRAYETTTAPRFTLEGPSVRLSPKAALALAMALHELATNAVKYGALSVEGGKVSLHWTVSGEGVEIEWRETGGPAVIAPTRKGFGSRLLTEGLVGDLGSGATLIYEPTGVICVFRTTLA